MQQRAKKILAQYPTDRWLAIDVFRGITVAAMILVNNPGSWSYVYSPLKHAEWHGWTPTDLIFPFFLFIVGLSLHIVVTRDLQANTSKQAIIQQALLRSLKLFGLGLFLALFYFDFHNPDFSWIKHQLADVRIMGVLQRIAIVYFATLLIMLALRTFRLRLLLALSILFGYWIMMALIPYQDESGEVYRGLYLFGNNLSAWLDNFVLTERHSYYPNAQPFSFDPEGLLSTLPAIASCLAGVLTGQFLTKTHDSTHRKVFRLLVTGFIIYCLGEMWGLYFPVNKNLWSSSFVALSTGIALIFFAIILWLVDLRKIKNWSFPFLIIGTNAIAAFVISGIVARLIIMIQIDDISLKVWLYQKIALSILDKYLASLGFAVLFFALIFLILRHLFFRQIYLKV